MKKMASRKTGVKEKSSRLQKPLKASKQVKGGKTNKHKPKSHVVSPESVVAKGSNRKQHEDVALNTSQGTEQQKLNEKIKKYQPKKSKVDDATAMKSPKRKVDEDVSDSEKSNKKLKTDSNANLKKKERKVLRKKASNNYELTVKMKQLWEDLRKREGKKDKAQTTKLAKQLYNLVKGKAKEVIYAHDTSRVIECLLATGGIEIRDALFEELKEEVVKMCMSTYSKFFVMKLLKHGSEMQRNYVVKQFEGKVIKLMRHVVAAGVIEEAYNEIAKAPQRGSIISEFYGPSYQLVQRSPEETFLSLKDIIAREPMKKEPILQFMKESLSQVITKKLFSHSLIHHIMFEFITHCNAKDKTELIESIRENLVEMLHTRDGSRLAMNCVWHGTAKDRKMIIKSMKGHMTKVACEAQGYLVLLAIFDSVDDTRLVSKALLDELMANLKPVIENPHGRKVILYLLSPRNPIHSHPDILKILKQGDDNPNSKKDRNIREEQLLTYVSKPLLQYVTNTFNDLINVPAESIVAQNVIKFAKGDISALYLKIAETVSKPYPPPDGEKHMIEDVAGHLFLKALIKDDVKRHEDSITPLFCTTLLDIVETVNYSKWVTCNRGCFVLVCMMDTKIPSVVERLKKIMKPMKSHFAKSAGADILLKHLS